MSFLSLSIADIKLAELRKFTWRLYIAADTLSTTSEFELINKKEFTKAALDENSKTFVMYIATMELQTTMPIHPFRTPQVLDNFTLATLLWDQAFIKILAKYSDHINIFFLDLAIELLENIEVNEHAIELIDRK